MGELLRSPVPRPRHLRVHPDPVAPPREVAAYLDVVAGGDPGRAVRQGRDSGVAEYPVLPGGRGQHPSPRGVFELRAEVVYDDDGRPVRKTLVICLRVSSSLSGGLIIAASLAVAIAHTTSERS